ncbi:hypothetical protein BKA62DRAFT_644318, partial [Auriculariales sp. MPI-PUGE-AT-0066]
MATLDIDGQLNTASATESVTQISRSSSSATQRSPLECRISAPSDAPPAEHSATEIVRPVLGHIGTHSCASSTREAHIAMDSRGQSEVECSEDKATNPTNLPWMEIADERYPLPDPSRFTEYEMKYTPDKYGEELEPHARVFKIYRDRVTEKDGDLVQGWHETLNILLVFAGLFSSVLTGFLAESSKLLQPDHAETTATAVLAILARLEGSNGTSTIAISSSTAPTDGARWVNRLWYTSLALALVVALLSILVKQWLVEYTSTVRSFAGDPRRWAWRHVALRQGLSEWGIGAFILWLAVLMHCSLFLFMAGLSVFLSSLDRPIYLMIAALSSATAAFYVATIIAPFIWPACPSRTPFHRQLERWIPPLINFLGLLLFSIVWMPPVFIFVMIWALACGTTGNICSHLKGV